jgi:hypothetical protein
MLELFSKTEEKIIMFKNKIKKLFTLYLFTNIQVNSKVNNIVNMLTNKSMVDLVTKNLLNSLNIPEIDLITKFTNTSDKFNHKSCNLAFNINFLKNDKNLRYHYKLCFNPSVLWSKDNKTIFDSEKYKQYNNKGVAVAFNNYQVLQTIENPDHLETFLQQKFNKSILGIILKLCQFEVIRINNKGLFIEFKIDNLRKTGVFNKIGYFPFNGSAFLAEDEFPDSTNMYLGIGQIYESKNKNNSLIFGIKGLNDLKKIDLMLNEALLIESFRAIAFISGKLKHFTLTICFSIQYTYDKDKFIEQYKNAKDIYNVTLSTENNNGNVNMKIPLTLVFFNFLTIEVLYNLPTKKLNHLIEMKIFDNERHKLVIGATTQGVNVDKEYIKNLQNITSLNAYGSYTIKIGKFEVKIKIKDADLINQQKSCNPFNENKYDYINKKFSVPALSFSFSYEDKKSNILPKAKQQEQEEENNESYNSLLTI